MKTTQGLIIAAAVWLGYRLTRGILSRRGDLANRIVLISGGSRGLGLALARRYASLGAIPAICARSEKELRRVQREFEDRGQLIHTHVCDMSDQAQVQAWINSVMKRFGRIDVLVNNAGIIQVGPMSAMGLDDFRAAMDTMFYGALYPTWEALPVLKKQKGRIINITSIGGMVAVPHLLPYSCAKFATVGFSQGLGAELRNQGVRVTTVVPGLMRTGSYLHAFFKGKRNEEFNWFSLGASLPLITVSAERAVDQIIEAGQRGTPFITLGVPAKAIRIFYSLFPGLGVRLMSAVDRWILPKSVGTGEQEKPADKGMLYQDTAPSRNFTRLGRRAARKYGEAA